MYRMYLTSLYAYTNIILLIRSIYDVLLCFSVEVCHAIIGKVTIILQDATRTCIGVI